jgi:hypothetical protein
MFPLILFGAIAAYSAILGIIGYIADRHHRAGWQRLIDERW